MTEGFDYEAYKAQLQGANPDRALLVTFEYAPKKMKDGSFTNVEMIRIWMDRNQEVVREITQQDKMRFSDRYSAFKKCEEMPKDGTPISMCAFATPADVSSCKAERIFTLEQLVETPDERLQRAHLVNLKYKSRDWLESQKRSGYVGELRDQIEALKKQVNMLKERLSEKGVEEPKPKRRGRPPKVKDDTVELNQ